MSGSFRTELLVSFYQGIMNDRYELNKNLAQMLKGGVIMDVTTPEQAKIA